MILDNPKLRIVVIGYLQNKELVGETWSQTDSMKTLKYFLVYSVNNKEIVHQLDLIGALWQAKVKNRVFVKLESRYTDYFPGYSIYFGRALRSLKSVYGMNNSGKLFTADSTEWLLEAGLIQSQCQMSIYYKYALDEKKMLLLSYVDDCLYWYTSEVLGNWFLYALGKRFHVKFLRYAHWFI